MSNFFKRWSSLKSENATKPTSSPKNLVDEKSIDARNIDFEKNSVELQNPILDKSTLDSQTKTSLDQQPLVTMEDVKQLTADSDFSNFVNKDIASDVHQAAMKKLFSDPHFNVMDGLDIYIDDYSISEPIPASMLEKMYQSTALGLFNSITEASEEKTDENPQRNLSHESTQIASQTPQEVNVDETLNNEESSNMQGYIENEKNPSVKVEKNDDNANL
jgi:hypothetical protein